MEIHKLQPFLPQDMKILMLGSFPPTYEKWSMEFYYPNFQNDMWRIFGLMFFQDKNYFIREDTKKFDRERIIKMLEEYKIGVGDSALTVRRLKNNASDKFLEIVDVLDFCAVLNQFPTCHALVSTGEKSAEIIKEYFELPYLPKIGEKLTFDYMDREMCFYRVPSSSRAYPKSLVDKTTIYQQVFDDILL